MSVYPCVTLNHLTDFRFYEVLLALHYMLMSVIAIMYGAPLHCPEIYCYSPIQVFFTFFFLLSILYCMFNVVCNDNLRADGFRFTK